MVQLCYLDQASPGTAILQEGDEEGKRAKSCEAAGEVAERDYKERTIS